MNTETLVLTDLLDCGYADISMLDILYSDLAEGIGMDSQGILKDSLTYGGDLNSVIVRAYEEITSAITNRLTNLMDDYVDTLRGGKPTEDTRDTDLQYLLDRYLYTDEETEDHDLVMKPLTKRQLNIIYDKIEEMENSSPYANFLDSHFQNDLDQTLDEEDTLDNNCKALIEYWVFRKL